MKNWSLSKKIWSIIGGLAAVFVLSTTFSLMSLMELRDSLNEVTGPIVKRDQLTSEIKDNQRILVLNASEAILFKKPENLKSNQKDFEEIIAKQDRDIKAYDAIATKEGKALMKEYSEIYQSLLEDVQQVRELGKQNKNEKASEIYINMRETKVPKLRDKIQDANELTATILSEKSREANSSAERAIWLSIAISSVSIILSFLISFLVLRALTGAINQIVKGLSDSSAQVTSAATQIASASEQLSQATTEQAASLEETAASVEEMNSMVAKNSENANSAASTSGKSQDAVNQGKQVIGRMIESMSAINRSSEGMAEIVKVIEQIDKKTKVINEIVNKTELLSFNASVEAARAGEHGKGFAVVAEEVGNLARMSGSAAEEISTLLEDSISKVNRMVEDTKQNVSLGSQVTQECGDVFEEIVQNVSSVSGMANEIASASQEQARGCGEITKAMNQLDQMTQQNAATSEECASAAEELSAQAEALKNAVTQLVYTVSGNDGSHHEIHAKTPTHVIHAVPKQSTASTAAAATQNVVHLKSKAAKPVSRQEGKLRKASGDIPSYDNDGFKEV